MIAHVICCNDAIEAVVLDDEDRAKQVLATLKEAYWERHKESFQESWGHKDPRRNYEARCYWHIHSVDVK